LREPERREAVEQHVARLGDAVALRQLRVEEDADAGLAEEAFARVLDQERAAGQMNAAGAIYLDPPLPERARHVAEHRAAIEPLGIACHRRDARQNQVLLEPRLAS